jgi:cation diffusion facilitator family transporter
LSISPPRDEAAIAIRQRVYLDAGRAAFWGLGVNIVLATVKLTGGLLAGSAALIADAVNSVGDVASAVAVRGALVVAQFEEDEDHPYGHTKAESIAGLSVALLVVFGAGMLMFETVGRLLGEPEPPGIVAGLIAAGCGIVKEGSYRYTRKVARRLDSAALRAAAWDHRSDAITSAVVAVSLLIAPYAGPIGPYVDPLAALVVCVVLVATGVRMFVMTARELMDQQAGAKVVEAVRAAAESVRGVADIEKLRVRKSGLEYFIEIHVQVDGAISVNEGHEIGHQVKDRLLTEMPRVRDVHVHIEPHDG